MICVGRRAQWMALEAVACGCPPENVHRCETNQEALRVLRQVIQRKSVILVKGSRGMKMEEIVAGLAVMTDGAGLEAIE